MEINVKEIRKKRIEIEVKDFDFNKYYRKELQTMLVLILRHISKFDIHNKNLMKLNGDIQIFKFEIYLKKIDGNMERIVDTFLSAAGVSIWTKTSKVSRPKIDFCKGIPGFKIEYGYKE